MMSLEFSLKDLITTLLPKDTILWVVRFSLITIALAVVATLIASTIIGGY